MVMIRTPVSARAFFSWVSERPSRTPLSAKSFRFSAIFIPRSAVSLRTSGRGSWGVRMRFGRQRRETRAHAPGDDHAGQCDEDAGVGVDEHDAPPYVDAGDPSRLLMAADGIDILPELGPRVEDERREGHDDQDENGDRDAEEI